ncbi:MAG: AAA domain-containing protein, partial [Sciscionella sp.]
MGDEQNEQVSLVRKAVNLFTFLGRTQELLVKPVRTADKFEEVMWFSDLPEHPAVHSAHRLAGLDADAPLLAVDRVPKLDPPVVPDQLKSWIDGPLDNSDQEPSIREAIYDAPFETTDGEAAGLQGAGGTRSRVELADVPEVEAAFADWLSDWKLWAERERRDAVARDIYKELFEVHLRSTDHSEEFELVLGVGCLSW